MKIGKNRKLALPDTDFGWEPRTLDVAADLKSLPQTFYITEATLKVEKRNRKKARSYRIEISDFSPLFGGVELFPIIFYLYGILQKILLTIFPRLQYTSQDELQFKMVFVTY
jgi:hypothetical protein